MSDSAVLSDSAALVPREVFIGDQAVLSFPSAGLTRLLSPGERFELGPAELPEPTVSATVLSVVIARGTAEDTDAVASVTFVPWNVGAVQLPPFYWKNVKITPPPVTIASIVDRTGIISLEPPRPPFLVPGTTWLLYGLALGTVLAVILMWITVRRILSYSFGNRSARRAARRLRHIRSELSRLERRIRRLEPGLWYAELSASFRRYLSLLNSDRERQFDALTSREAVDVLAETFSGAEIPGEIRQWLETFDRIRFSGEPGEDLRKRHTAELRDLVSRAERAERAERTDAGGDSDGRL